MKQTALTLFFGLIAAAPLLADDATPVRAATNSANPFTDERQQAGYALGMMIGHNLQQQGVDVDWDVFMQGLKDVQSGGATLLTPQQMQETLNDYKKTVAARQQQMREEQGGKTKAAGEKFLRKNKKKSGVKTLPDGWQYKIITKGTGA